MERLAPIRRNKAVVSELKTETIKKVTTFFADLKQTLYICGAVFYFSHHRRPLFAANARAASPFVKLCAYIHFWPLSRQNLFVYHF